MSAREKGHAQPAVTKIFRLGLLQAKVELTNRFTRWTALAYLVAPLILFAVFSFLDLDIVGGDEGARRIIAGFAAASLFVTGFVGITSELVTEQEDGSVLRAKTIPHGLTAYLVGKIISLSATSLLTVLLTLVAAQLALGAVLPTSLAAWLALVGLALLTLAATAPLGASLGSLARSPIAILPISLVAYGLMFVSGIFFPLSLMPEWVGGIVKMFPLYWLGLDSRVILLPAEQFAGPLDAALGIIVPLAWAIGGAFLAPLALGAMSRRQSGARLQEVQERRASRGY